MASSTRKLPLILALIMYFSLTRDVIFITIVASIPRYVPVENVPLNCGSPDNLPAQDNRLWTADREKDSRFSLRESKGEVKSNMSIAVIQESSVDIVPYMTARVSRSQFTYSFLVTPGPKFIRLYFYPARYRGYDDFDPSDVFFTVKAGRFTLLRNFSAYLTAKSSDQSAFMKEFCIYVKENIKKLDVTFLPSPNPSSEPHGNNSYVFVNGIEIVSMPATLYYTPTGDHSPAIVGQGSRFIDYSDMALEMFYRLNVGGSAISPMQDTGMYREWTQDRPYFMSEGFAPGNISITLKYSAIPNYTAPDNVYRTAIILGNNTEKNTLRDLTWKLPVHSRFYYLVRLHFCEFQEFKRNIEDKIFRIYVNNQTVYYTFMVTLSSGGIGVPIYNDFVVNIQDEAHIFLDMQGRRRDSVAILNGIEVFKMSNPDGNLAGPNPQLVNSPGSNVPALNYANKSESKKTLLAIFLGSGVSGVLILLSVVCCLFFMRLRKHKLHYNPRKRNSNRPGRLPEQLCHHFSLSDIKMATNNFEQSLVIGRGGFGYVYKGHLGKESTGAVAIKRLNRGSRQGEREFEAEIMMLSQLRHVHLVSLIGFCDDDDEMILVYDYMANGTLRDHLYGTNNDPLPWKQRLEISVGAARGLHYLHAEVINTIIHRDVKTTNILLDEKWVAKVADFGLSKLGRGDNDAVSTAVKGTFGYMDPEYAQSRHLTDKSDVYSFGVVLFEVLCARKPVDVKLEEDQRNLAQWARKCTKDGKIQNIIDPYLVGKIAPKCFKKFVRVAESCVRDYRNQRPTMREVMEMLEFALELQEQADKAKQGSNPGGGYSYPEQLSFHLADHNHGTRGGYDVLGLESGADFTTWVSSSTAGLSVLSMESESGTREIFSGSANSKSQ